MASEDLLLDPAIRLWVVFPIIIIAYCIGLCRHYASVLVGSQPEAKPEALKEANVLERSARLRINGQYIPRHAFLARKQYFNGDKTGILSKAKSENENKQPVNPMQDPSMMTDMMKKQMINMVPMVVIGGLINWVFSGFVIIRVPFPLTIAFKPMLQRGIELTTLSASWVSSMSFYFTCVFGLSAVYTLALGSNNEADQSAMMQQQMAMTKTPQQPGQAYKAEWEALQVMRHDWALHSQQHLGSDVVDVRHDLAGVEQDLIRAWA